MAQDLLEDAEVHALGEHERRSRVPKVLEALMR
jgi:hypothetical protein